MQFVTLDDYCCAGFIQPANRGSSLRDTTTNATSPATTIATLNHCPRDSSIPIAPMRPEFPNCASGNRKNSATTRSTPYPIKNHAPTTPGLRAFRHTNHTIAVNTTPSKNA